MSFKDILKNNNINQIEIAVGLGVKQQTISKWCTKKSFPSIPTIHKIAKILGESPTTIFECFEVTNDK